MIDDPPDHELVPGFERISLIGRGGSATVYSATRTGDGANVALKVFDAGNAASFDRQMRASERLADVAGVLPVDEAPTLLDGRRCVTMPYASGGSLQDHMDRFGRIPPDRIANYGAQLAHGLARAHHAGVMHRDLKPSNLLMTGDDAVVLADFGAAALVDVATATATMAVTVMYAAPEVLEGAPAGPASDVYSLGLSLLALAAGHTPFTDANDSGLKALVNNICVTGVPEALSADLPPGLAAVLRRAVALDPDERYEMAVDFADALDAVRVDPDVVPPGISTTIRPRGRSRRTLGVVAAAAIVVIALVVGALWWRSIGDDGAQPTASAIGKYGPPVTKRNGIMGPLYRQDDITYVGLLDHPCEAGAHLAELSTHAGPADTAAKVATPWKAVTGDGVGVFMAWMPCDTKIDEARFKLGATGRWFVYVAEFPEAQYQKMVTAMRDNETSPSPDYTVDEDVLHILEDPKVYKGWALIDRPA